MPRMPLSRVRALRWTAVAAWAGLIFALSSLSGSQVSIGIDVSALAHFTEYAILGGLLLFALERSNRGLAAVALASAYGVTDELHQLLVPGRMSDPVDWAVDTAGAIAGAALAAWLLRRRAERESALTSSSPRQ